MSITNTRKPLVFSSGVTGAPPAPANEGLAPNDAWPPPRPAAQPATSDRAPYLIAAGVSVVWTVGAGVLGAVLFGRRELAIIVVLAVTPMTLIWAAAFTVAQARSLLAETRRTRLLTDQLAGPAAAAAATVGAVVEAMHVQIVRASDVAAVAGERLTALREALDEESGQISRAASTADASARNLVERLSSQRGELNTLAVTLDARAAAVTDAINRQSRMVAEASDLAESQLREAEASLAARTAGLAAAASQATDISRTAGEDLARQAGRLETAGVGVGDQLRSLEEGLTQQRAALVTVAHALRAEQETFGAMAETRTAQLSAFLTGAGEDVAALNASAAAGAKSTSELIAALAAAAAQARLSADEHARAAHARVEQLNEVAFAAGQKADQVFEARLDHARGLIGQSVKLVEEAGAATTASLDEGLGAARAALNALRGMIDEVAADAARLPAQTGERANEVREAVAKGMEELLAVARETSRETQAIDAAFQERVRRNYEMLSEAVQLMGVVAQGGQGAPVPRRISVPAAQALAAPPQTPAAPQLLPGAEASQRPRLKLTPTASDAEFKAVFDAASTGAADGDKTWTWNQLLTSIDGEAAAPDVALGRGLFAEIAAMGIDPAALLSRARVEEIAAAIQTGDAAGAREVVRNLAPAAVRRLSRRLIGDAEFRARRAAYIGRYAQVIESAAKRDPRGFHAASLLASDIGRVYLLLDATAGEAED